MRRSNMSVAGRAALCVAALGAAFFVAACGLAGKALDPAVDVLARGIDEACKEGMTPLAIEARKEIVAEINAKTRVGNHTPSDCDGDGEPDFAIDSDGMPAATPLPIT